MRFDRLDLNLLFALDTLIERCNVSLAAKDLCLSQSAMSGALNRLRDYFEDDLLVQSGRKMLLTPKAMELAHRVAGRSLPALRAAKICNNAAETMTWDEAYILGQKYSAELTAGSDSKEGIRAFLEKREPSYQDR